MSYNGSGSYSLPAGNPVVSGTTISPTTHNTTMSDIATALTNVICRDGQTTITANLPMAGYKLTGLAAGSANGDSVRYEQYAELRSTGKGNSAPSGIVAGQMWIDDDTPSGTIWTLNMYDGSASISMALIDTSNDWVIPLLGAGDPTVPSLSFAGDTNTGIYRPTSDALAVTTGGAERVRFADAACTMQTGVQLLLDDSTTSASAPALAFDGDPNTGIYRTGADALAITTGGTQRVSVSSTGLVGIGAPTVEAALNTSKLYSEGLSTFQQTANGAAAMVVVHNFAGSQTFVQFNQGGAPSTAVGSISVSGGVTAYNTTSDGRLKDNPRVIEHVGSVIDAIRPVEFEWKDGSGTGHGFIAQELHAIYPEAVTPGDPDFESDPVNKRPWMIDYSKIVPYLVAEVQDLRRRVAALEQR